MNARAITLFAGLALAATNASAVNYTINWMQMTPTPMGSAPPFSGSYTLPGIGVVGMTYSANTFLNEVRTQTPAITNGSVAFGPDTYSWTNHEHLARVNSAGPGPNVLQSWFVTYTFPGTVPAGTVVLGVAGLGRRNPTNPGETAFDTTSTATVLQNGTLLGDFTNGNNWGATQFTSSLGMFSMQNSQVGNGGADPWWNTGLGIVRIDDATNSLTVRFNHTSGDGFGVNIGVLVPSPGAAALAGLSGLLCLRRRRR
jgi:hypothetical protein